MKSVQSLSCLVLLATAVGCAEAPFDVTADPASSASEGSSDVADAIDEDAEPLMTTPVPVPAPNECDGKKAPIDLCAATPATTPAACKELLSSVVCSLNRQEGDFCKKACDTQSIFIRPLCMRGCRDYVAEVPKLSSSVAQLFEKKACDEQAQKTVTNLCKEVRSRSKTTPAQKSPAK